MSGSGGAQKSIKEFFSPEGSGKVTKRRKTEEENSNPNAPAGDGMGGDTESKKPRLESLSPQQKERMAGNKLVAQMKLHAKKFPAAFDAAMGPSWYSALRPEFDKPYFQELDSFLAGERASKTIYPSAPDVWTWTKRFPLAETRVVVLGQDPYHGPGQAHGLCFSVRRGVRAPPSLVNMFKELSGDVAGFRTPDHGDLTGWADQGVLLLNACLTVEKSKANAHKDRGWERVTDAAIKAVSDGCEAGVVFLLWGSYAQKKASAVDAKKHHLLKAPHPSPLSAHRGFLGCGHFSKCNELLAKAGKKTIDWGKLD